MFADRHLLFRHRVRGSFIRGDALFAWKEREATFSLGRLTISSCEKSLGRGSREYLQASSIETTLHTPVPLPPIWKRIIQGEEEPLEICQFVDLFRETGGNISYDFERLIRNRWWGRVNRKIKKKKILPRKFRNIQIRLEIEIFYCTSFQKRRILYDYFFFFFRKAYRYKIYFNFDIHSLYPYHRYHTHAMRFGRRNF